jgi:tetratricopeptide (TPR) repeat protein
MAHDLRTLRVVSAGLAAATILLVLPATADAQGRRRGAQAQAATSSRDEEARMLFEAGRVAYEDGRFEDALGYFQRAHDLSGRPALLYNVGSAADKLRRDAVALDAFRRYLEALPTAENRGEVEARIRVLEQVVGAAAQAGTVGGGPGTSGGPGGADASGAVGAGHGEGGRGDMADASADAADRPDAATAPGAESRVAASLVEASADDRPRDGGGSLLGKWWFWGIVGAVVVAGAVVAIAATAGAGLGPYATGDDGRVYMTLGGL